MSEPQVLTIRFTRADGLVQHAICEPGRALSVGSHNGTFVNGTRVDEVGVTVAAGDLVSTGEWEGRVELTPARRPGSPISMPAVGAANAFNTVVTNSEPGANFGQVAGAPVATPTATALGGRVPASTSAPATIVSGMRAVTVQKGQSGPHARPTTTMVLPMSMRIADEVGPAMTPAPGQGWGWEESPAATNESVRAARLDENPIVKRFAETSTSLDFRGLSDLPALEGDAAATSMGMRAQGQAIDSIALRLVFKVTEALQSTDSMDDFLREMCEQLAQAARAKGVIVLLPGDDGALEPRVMKQRRADEKIELSRTVIDYVVTNKAALTTEDAAADERFARGESVLRFDLKAVLCVPLVRREADGTAGDVIGVLYLTRDLPFTNTERDLVAALAHLIAMGLERTRLRTEFANAERTRRSLERFHAPDVVRRLMMESSEGVHRDGLFLEPLTATILFCDLAGFTSFCEAHEPEQVGTLLNSYLGTMTETVFAHGGTVDKFIGDAVMCIFGAPFNGADDAMRGVQCAIDMRRNFRALVQSGAVGEDARALDVHIGVNTGKVVAGTVGSPRRMEYTALGDTVNIAARLEGVAKSGQIVVGPMTASLVGGVVPLLSLGIVSLKGKGQGVELFEVPDSDDDFFEITASTGTLKV